MTWNQLFCQMVIVFDVLLMVVAAHAVAATASKSYLVALRAHLYNALHTKAIIFANEHGLYFSLCLSVKFHKSHNFSALFVSNRIRIKHTSTYKYIKFARTASGKRRKIFVHLLGQCKRILCAVCSFALCLVFLKIKQNKNCTHMRICLGSSMHNTCKKMSLSSSSLRCLLVFMRSLFSLSSFSIFSESTLPLCDIV